MIFISNPAFLAASSTAKFPAKTITSAILTSFLLAMGSRTDNVFDNLLGSLTSQSFEGTI